MGSDLRMDFIAVGQTTHLAARMEQLARPGTTLLSISTLKLAEGYVQVRPLGTMPIKGVAEHAEVFELAGPGSARTRLQAAAARGLTHFVGRQRELCRWASGQAQRSFANRRPNVRTSPKRTHGRFHDLIIVAAFA